MTQIEHARLQLEYLAPHTLLPDPKNPRMHRPPQVAAIASSISAFGFNVPILVNSLDQVVAGHGRLAAALKLELALVPVIRANHLSGAQQQAYTIADNRLTDSSRWNDQLLGEVLRDLTLSDLSFDIEAIGFSVTEIDLKIDALQLGEEARVEDAVSSGPPVSQPGDLWTFTKNRLLCGSSLVAADWSSLMAGKKAAMTFADFPYNVPINGHVSGLGKIKHREFPMGSSEMTRTEFIAFLRAGFELMVAHSASGSLHYACMDWKHAYEMATAGEAVFSKHLNTCVWAKDRAGMGAFYRSQTELIFVWKHGEAKHRNNVQLGRYGRNRSNLWSYPAIGGFRHSEGTDLLASHPTCKPVALVADAILDSTKRGEIVVDPFMGSGTTLVAAQRVGRVAYGIELDPLYVDGAIRRFTALTGETAVHAKTGMSFDEVAADRAAVRS